MNYQIRKVQPAVKEIKPKWQVSKQLVKKMLPKQNSTISTADNDSPQRPRMKKKQSIQTIMMAKSSYVEKLNISSTSWCLYDSKCEQWIGFRERNQREIASLTKIMTALLSIELFDKFEIPKDCKVKVTELASKMIGTSAQLKPKVWINLWDLLYGAMLPSGNDASYLLAEILGFLLKNGVESFKSLRFIDITNQNTTQYTVEFIKLMNKRAQSLELSSTTFSNPHGLQNAMNMSCPRDLILLCEYASKNQIFREVMNSNYFRYYYWEEKKDIPGDVTNQEKLNSYCKVTRKNWWNTNVLLKKGWEGIKTGQTAAAGSCLASLRSGIYIIVLNCRDNEARFNETEKIYDWYCSKKLKKQVDDSESQSL